MNSMAVLFISAGICILFYTFKKIRLRYFILSALSGLSALFAVDLILGLAGLNMPYNTLTLLCAAAGGLPGVIVITLLNGMM